MKTKASARRTHRTHNSAFKARVAPAALREDKTLVGRGKEFEPRPNQIAEWKHQLLKRAAEKFTAVVLVKGCKLPMDRRGARRDNVFVEWFWRSVKYERVYLRAYENVNAANADITEYLAWYNTYRPRSSVKQFTPDEKYMAVFSQLEQPA